MKNFILTLSFIGAICVSFTACTPKAKKTTLENKGTKEMKIKAISYSSSNPSMGPHNVNSSNYLDMEAYPKELDNFLDNTTLNSKISLRKYLDLLNTDSAKANNFLADIDSSRFADGERITDLNFHLKDGSTITFADLRNYRLSGSGYSQFNEFIKEKGLMDSSSDENISPSNVPVNTLTTE